MGLPEYAWHTGLGLVALYRGDLARCKRAIGRWIDKRSLRKQRPGIQ